MTITSVIENRCEPRYEISRGRSVEVLVRRKSDESEETILGELSNLSAGGVQISVPVYPKFSEEIGLQIKIPDAKVTIDTNAYVCWIRPTEDNQCLIGCSFAMNLSEAVLDRLAAAEIIDRRRHPRRLVSIPGNARWELDANSFPVQITDYSEGGFCMASGRPSTVGRAVSIELDAPDTAVRPISGRVCWQEERDGEYVVGCSLTRVEDFEQLRRFCRVAGDEHGTAPSRFGAQAGKTLFLAVMWLFVFFGSTVLGLKAIESWRGQLTMVGLDGTERNPVALAFNSDTELATADANHRLNCRDFTGIEAKDEQHDADLSAIGHHITPDTTPEKMNLVPIGHIVSLQPAADGMPLVEQSNAPARFGQDDPSIVSFERLISVDRIPRHTPTPIRALRETQDTLAETTTHAPNNLTRRINDSVNLGQVGPSADITMATEAFVVGDGFYRTSRYDQAKSAFQTAVEKDSANALYYYLLAMTHYQLGQFREAEHLAQKAIHLEKESPIEDWGSRLIRYQGHARLWVEKLRSAFQNAVNN